MSAPLGVPSSRAMDGPGRESMAYFSRGAGRTRKLQEEAQKQEFVISPFSCLQPPPA